MVQILQTIQEWHCISVFYINRFRILCTWGQGARILFIARHPRGGKLDIMHSVLVIRDVSGFQRSPIR